MQEISPLYGSVNLHFQSGSLVISNTRCGSVIVQTIDMMPSKVSVTVKNMHHGNKLVSPVCSVYTITLNLQRVFHYQIPKYHTDDLTS